MATTAALDALTSADVLPLAAPLGVVAVALAVLRWALPGLDWA